MALKALTLWVFIIVSLCVVDSHRLGGGGLVSPIVMTEKTLCCHWLQCVTCVLHTVYTHGRYTCLGHMCCIHVYNTCGLSICIM